MEEQHLARFGAIVAAIQKNGRHCAEIRDLAADIVLKSCETASIRNENIYLAKTGLNDMLRNAVHSQTESEVMRWLAQDPKGPVYIEEYVKRVGGWNGQGFLALARDAKAYAVADAVYEAIRLVKTVTLQ